MSTSCMREVGVVSVFLFTYYELFPQEMNAHVLVTQPHVLFVITIILRMSNLFAVFLPHELTICTILKVCWIILYIMIGLGERIIVVFST